MECSFQEVCGGHRGGQTPPPGSAAGDGLQQEQELSGLQPGDGEGEPAAGLRPLPGGLVMVLRMQQLLCLSHIFLSFPCWTSLGVELIAKTIFENTGSSTVLAITPALALVGYFLLLLPVSIKRHYSR